MGFNIKLENKVDHTFIWKQRPSDNCITEACLPSWTILFGFMQQRKCMLQCGMLCVLCKLPWWIQYPVFKHFLTDVVLNVFLYNHCSHTNLLKKTAKAPFDVGWKIQSDRSVEAWRNHCLTEFHLFQPKFFFFLFFSLLCVSLTRSRVPTQDHLYWKGYRFK